MLVSLPKLCGCAKPSKVVASVKAEESVKEQILNIPTKDGAMETFVCHPERGGPYPPVLFLMDAPGIREEQIGRAHV